MPAVETWRWRIRWGGRMRTAPGHWTEAEIRREHPDAERIGSSLTLRNEPEGEPVANTRPADSMDPAIASAWTMPRRPGSDL